MVMRGVARVAMTGVVSVVMTAVVPGGKQAARRTSAAYLKAASSKRVLTRVVSLKGLMHPFLVGTAAGERLACPPIPMGGRGVLTSDMPASVVVVRGRWSEL